MVAVLLSPSPASATLLSPVTVAVLLSPPAAMAVLLSPVTVAVLLSPPMALAKLLSPVDGGGVVVAEASHGTCGSGDVAVPSRLWPSRRWRRDARVVAAAGRGRRAACRRWRWRCSWCSLSHLPCCCRPWLLPLNLRLGWWTLARCTFLYLCLTVLRDAHVLSVALTVPRLGRCRPWRRGQPYPDAQGDR